MMFALHGAERRLLPQIVTIPLFALAVVAQPVVWMLLGLWAGDAAQTSVPGITPMLGVVHMLTIGLILPVAIVVTMQVLCVVMMQSPPPVWRSATLATLFVAGGFGLIGGALTGHTQLLSAGSAMAAASLLLFAVELARMLVAARHAGFPDSRLALGVSLAALLGFATLAACLGVDPGWGGFGDRAAMAAGHAILAVFGFMGFLALGFSLLLVPMLAISDAPASGRARAQILIAALGLALAVTGVIADLQILTVAGSLCGLGAAGWHVHMMEAVLRKRLRRNLGEAFILVRSAWAMMLVSLAVAATMAMGWLPPDPGMRILGGLLLLGWLLGLITGILQRILPFLASMHVMSALGRATSPTSLTWNGPLRLHLACHLAAVPLAVLGLATGSALTIMAAASLGTLGGAAYAAFALAVLTRTAGTLNQPRRHHG